MGKATVWMKALLHGRSSVVVVVLFVCQQACQQLFLRLTRCCTPSEVFYYFKIESDVLRDPDTGEGLSAKIVPVPADW